MRISRDKLNKLAHTVADTLAEIPECDFLEDRIRSGRRRARRSRSCCWKRRSWMRRRGLKIASQRKIIVEGSQEWDILYRKYYNDEVKKLGI